MLHLAVAPKQSRMVRDNLDGHNDATELAFAEGIDRASQEAMKESLPASVGPWNSRHVAPPQKDFLAEFTATRSDFRSPKWLHQRPFHAQPSDSQDVLGRKSH